jgi:hypothetical protein
MSKVCDSRAAQIVGEDLRIYGSLQKSPSGRDGLPEEQTVVIKGLLSLRMGASSAAHATGSASQSGIFCLVRSLNCEWSVTADSEQREPSKLEKV